MLCKTHFAHILPNLSLCYNFPWPISSIQLSCRLRLTSILSQSNGKIFVFYFHSGSYHSSSPFHQSFSQQFKLQYLNKTRLNQSLPGNSHCFPVCLVQPWPYSSTSWSFHAALPLQLFVWFLLLHPLAFLLNSGKSNSLFLSLYLLLLMLTANQPLNAGICRCKDWLLHSPWRQQS